MSGAFRQVAVFFGITMFEETTPDHSSRSIVPSNEPRVASEGLVMTKNKKRVEPTVGIIMGSNSDWKTMRRAKEVLDACGIANEPKVVSAHRTPDDMFAYAEHAEAGGLQFIIAGAGGAAHLPGMTASKTIVPVVGVPVVATPLNGIDALLSIMQMPSEVGVATVSIGEALERRRRVCRVGAGDGGRANRR